MHKKNTKVAKETCKNVYKRLDTEACGGVDIDFNDEFKAAFKEMEDTQNHIYITGRAGTGKSTLLKYFKETTGKKIVVLSNSGDTILNYL